MLGSNWNPIAARHLIGAARRPRAALPTTHPTTKEDLAIDLRLSCVLFGSVCPFPVAFDSIDAIHLTQELPSETGSRVLVSGFSRLRRTAACGVLSGIQ